MEKIGFIGIGDQGGPMARRIGQAGFDLTLWARRPEALEAYADTGASFAPSIAALGEACGIVGVCVFADADVEQVVGELLSTMREGGIILIHSTVSPGTCVKLAGQGRDKGIAVLDAPVSGGNARALAGELTVMVGGDREAFERALPVLKTFAKHAARLGEAGAGQICKLLNNSMTTIHFATALAFFDAGEKLGLDHAAFTAMLAGGSAQSFGLETMAAARPNSLTHALPRLEKDVSLALAVMSDGGLAQCRAAELARAGLEKFSAYANESAAG